MLSMVRRHDEGTPWVTLAHALGFDDDHRDDHDKDDHDHDEDALGFDDDNHDDHDKDDHNDDEEESYGDQMVTWSPFCHQQ